MPKKKPNIVKCDVIKAGRFELEDKDGTVRAELMLVPETGPVFRLFAEDGTTRLELAVDNGYPVALLRSRAGRCARLAVRRGWGPDGSDGVVFDLFGDCTTH